MKTLIIEDEKAALRNLKAVMQEVDTDFEIVGEVDSIFVIMTEVKPPSMQLLQVSKSGPWSRCRAMGMLGHSMTAASTSFTR